MSGPRWHHAPLPCLDINGQLMGMASVPNVTDSCLFEREHKNGWRR